MRQQVSSTQTYKNVLKYFAHVIFLFYSNNTEDHYLGRHENEDIHDFMYLLYGPIIRKKLKVTLCLLFFAASLVNHSGTFEDIMLQIPNHFFQGSQCSLIDHYLEG